MNNKVKKLYEEFGINIPEKQAEWSASVSNGNSTNTKITDNNTSKLGKNAPIKYKEKVIPSISKLVGKDDGTKLDNFNPDNKKSVFTANAYTLPEATAYVKQKNAEATEAAKIAAAKEAEASTAAGIVTSVYGDMVGGYISALGTALDKLQGKQIDPNASYYRMNLRAQAAQQALQDKAANAIGAEDNTLKRYLSDKAVGVGLDVLKTVARLPMAEAGIKSNLGNADTFIGRTINKMTSPSLGTLTVALSEGSNTLTDVKNRGGNDKQAMGLGLIAAINGGLWENVSANTLLEGKSAKTLGQAITLSLMQMGADGLEEFNTDVGNDIADRIIMGEKSNFNTYKNKYMEYGLSEEDASKKANIDIAKSALESFASGAAAGAITGGAKTVIDTASSKIEKDINVKNKQYESLFNEYKNGNADAYEANPQNYDLLTKSDIENIQNEAVYQATIGQETVKPLAKAETIQNQQNTENSDQNIQNNVEDETPIDVSNEEVRKEEAKASFKDFLQTGNQNVEYNSDLINSLTEEEKERIRSEVYSEYSTKAKENKKETKQEHIERLNQAAVDIVKQGGTEESIDTVLNNEFPNSLSADDLEYIANRVEIEKQIANAVEDYNNGNTKNLNEKYGAAVLGEASKRVGENQNIESKTNKETSFEYEAQAFVPNENVSKKVIDKAISSGEVKVYANSEIKDGTPIYLSREEALAHGEIAGAKTIGINDAVWKNGLKGGGVYGTSETAKSGVAYSVMPKPLPKATNILRETRNGVTTGLPKSVETENARINNIVETTSKPLATAEETASKVKGENNERNNVSGAGDERNLQERAGKQAGIVSEGSENRTDTGTGAEKRTEKSGNSEKDAKEVIPNAKEGQKVSVVSKENDTKETAEARKFAEDCGVKNVTIINSDNDINTTNGSRIRAWWNPKTDEVGAIGNSKKEKVIAFVKHELTERAIGNGKVNVNEVSEKIASVVSVEDYNKMLNGYLPQNFENLSDAQQEEAINEAVKELVCDAYGGINQFKNHSKFADLSDGMSKIIDSVKADANEVFAQKYDSKSDKDTVYSDSTKVSDSAYMKAVESGDTETAQNMVDEAAKKAGYIYKAYHGTNAEFNVFDKSKLGEKNFMASSARKAFFASESKETAENYTGLNSLDMMSLALNDESKNNMLSIREKYRFDDAEKSMKESRDKFIQKFKESTEEYKKSNKKIEDIENRKEEFEHLLGREGFEKFLNGEKENADYNLNVKYLNEANREFEKTDEYEKYKKISEKIASEWEKTEIDRKGYKPNVKNLLIKMENPLIHDYKKEGRNFDDYTDSFSQFIDEAKKNGNDGCIFKNVQDGGDFDTIYAVFDSNQFKSADPVTYDDKGNVIPLSERFNSEKDDIRYSSEINDNESKVNFGSMFSGSGTFDFAVRNMVNKEYAVEYNPQIAAVFKDNNGDDLFVGDVRDAVKQGYFKGKNVDYLHASPVCCNYSNQNNNIGEQELDIETAKSVAEAIKEGKPKIVTVENVKGYKKSEALNIVKEALDDNGYIYDEDVYRASDYGASTIRERYFLRAVKDAETMPDKPTKSTGKSWYEVTKDLIGDLKEMPMKANGYMENRWNAIKDSIDTSKPVLVLRGNKGGSLVYAEADEYAPTIIASESEARIVMPDGKVLEASPRVLARIQGLPDTFKLPSQKTTANRVIGNGIPVELSQAIAGSLLKEVDGITDVKFSSTINDNKKTIDVLSRYNKQNTKKETGVSFDEVKEAYNKIRNARNYYENSSKRNKLSSKENSILNLLMNGEMSWEEATRMGDVRIDAIKNVFEAKREYDKLTKTIKQHRAQKNSDLAKQADDVLDGYETWKDKKIGILYDTTTAERNIEDIAPAENAKKIIKNYFTPVKKDVKKTNDYKTAHRNVIRELNLSRKIADGNTVSESEAVQFIGEALDNLSRAENTDKVNGKTQVEWQQEINNFWKANPNLDKSKIENAIDVFRKEYDSILSDINEVRIRNGYEPIPYRQGYFMHFQDGEQDTILTSVKKAFGIETESVTLPTTINGLTEFFKPGIKWAGFALQRKGNDTKMDAVQGFDRYIETAADIVFLTDDIQRLRALAKQIRYNSSDDAVKEQIDKIMASEDLDSDAKSEAINSLYENDKTYALSNYVAWLDEYTNQLAGKKSRYDRAVEAAFGRNAIYKTVKNLNARLASNMVAVNPASWVTNFIPLTQAITTTDAKYIMKGMVDTLKNVNDSDGLIDRSTYLTNRLNESERLVERGEENANPTGKLAKATQRYTQVLNKIADKGNVIDSFTTEAVYRARYLQDIANGMSEVDALEDADDYTARLQADRSKGSTPTIFGATNPLIKTLTMFQLEVKNELDWAVKDVPKELKDKALGQIAASVMKFLVGTYLFNDVYEYFIGRRPAVDPLNLLNDTTGDLTGYKLPNMIDYALGEDDFKTKKRDIYSTGERLLSNVFEELPFVGGIMGGGRVPISSALPSASKIAKAATDTEMSSKKRVQDVTKELTKPIAYLALPGGGSQIKKTYEGAKALKEGGSYIYDKDGNKILQYPIYKDSTFDAARSGLRSLVFGKTANKTARDWVENDFKSLSAKQTELYDNLHKSGLTDRKSFGVVNELQGLDKKEKAKYLIGLNLKENVLNSAYISIQDKDDQLKTENAIDEANINGIRTKDYIEFKQFSSIQGKNKDEIVEYIDNMNITDDQKDYLYRSKEYAESKINETPWRSKSESSGASNSKFKTQSYQQETNMVIKGNEDFHNFLDKTFESKKTDQQKAEDTVKEVDKLVKSDEISMDDIDYMYENLNLSDEKLFQQLLVYSYTKLPKEMQKYDVNEFIYQYFGGEKPGITKHSGVYYGENYNLQKTTDNSSKPKYLKKY